VTFSFGQSERERIAVNVLRYERAVTGQSDDDNWLVVQIDIQAGGFRGKANASIMTDGLARFLSQLRPLYDTLSGAAEFTTLEEQLHLHLSGDGKGHVELKGEVMDAAGIGNALQFHLQFDQSQLAESIRQLEEVTSSFPIRGI
jgi:hypothetical protein